MPPSETVSFSLGPKAASTKPGGFGLHVPKPVVSRPRPSLAAKPLHSSDDDDDDGAAVTEPKSLDQEALDALLGKRTPKATLTIPSSSNANLTPRGTDSQAYRDDVGSLSDAPADYASVPLGSFGAAMLRGMRRREGDEPDGEDTPPYALKQRPNLLGIGAKEAPMDMEFGAWGKGDKRKNKSKRIDRNYSVPVARRNPETGEIVTEEEYLKMVGGNGQDEAPRERSGSPRRTLTSTASGSLSGTTTAASTPRRSRRDEEGSRGERSSRRERDAKKDRSEDWYERRDKDKRRDRDDRRDREDRRDRGERKSRDDRGNYDEKRDRKYRDDNDKRDYDYKRDQKHIDDRKGGEYRRDREEKKDRGGKRDRDDRWDRDDRRDRGAELDRDRRDRDKDDRRQRHDGDDMTSRHSRDRNGRRMDGRRR